MVLRLNGAELGGNSASEVLAAELVHQWTGRGSPGGEL